MKRAPNMALLSEEEEVRPVRLESREAETKQGSEAESRPEHIPALGLPAGQERPADHGRENGGTIHVYTSTYTQGYTDQYPPHNRPLRAGHPGSVSNAPRPWETISIDIVSPTAVSTGGYTKILTIIDTFTRYVIAIPLTHADAEEISDALCGDTVCGDDDNDDDDDEADVEAVWDPDAVPPLVPVDDNGTNKDAASSEDENKDECDPVELRGQLERALLQQLHPATFSFDDIIEQWHRDSGTKCTRDTTDNTCQISKQEFAAHVTNALAGGAPEEDRQYYVWCKEQLDLALE